MFLKLRVLEAADQTRAFTTGLHRDGNLEPLLHSVLSMVPCSLQFALATAGTRQNEEGAA